MKKRLDTLVAQQHPEFSKTQIQGWIKAGCVMVEEKVIQKAGMLIDEHARIVLNAPVQRYVGRAGLKLEAALKHFAIDVQNLVALDAGLSTGGFTDCLLQHGVAKVYGVDVGHGQVHEKIRHDQRVVVIEGVNLRTLKDLPQEKEVASNFAHPACPSKPWRSRKRSRRMQRNLVDLITLDLSFISVLKVMDAVTQLIKPDGRLIVLIKPQFEAGPALVGPGGIIKDPLVHQKVVADVIAGITAHGFMYHGTIESPITGTDGNKEFLAYFSKL